MMRVVVDADACPGKAVIFRVCREFDVPVLLVASVAHRMPEEPGVEVLTVDPHPQSADVAIANHIGPGDVVVTQDWGLAAICMGRGAVALTPGGEEYEPERVEFLLEYRHGLERFRRGGGRHRGPRARTHHDDLRLEESLRRILRRLVGGTPDN